jgi:threonine/homoserine/homoserine lactone efflux protein
MTAYLDGILLAYGAFMIGIFSPGPNILAVMGTSMSVGRGAGKGLALGVATGSFLWGVMTLFGLTALITLFAGAMTVNKVFGAAYLLWLAYKAFRSAARQKEVHTRALLDEGGPGPTTGAASSCR